METHVMSMKDEGEGVYQAVILAPNHNVARRIFAKRMLIDYERDLCDSGETSLDEYAPARALIEDWVAERSMNCVSCGCGSTRAMEPREMALMGISPIVNQGKAHVCLCCASTWIAKGTYVPMREELETQAAGEIAGLDAFERTSLLGRQEGDGEGDGPE